jgi:antirestriction protein
MRVYITDLAAYNKGCLVGEWYTLPMSDEELKEAIATELQRGEKVCDSQERHEECFISDYECEYMKIGEYDSFKNLNEIATTMDSLNNEEKKAVKVMLENLIVKDINEAIENIENMICTGETRMENVAFNYLEESGMLQNTPEYLQRYFDYEVFGRDMQTNGNYYLDDEGIIWEYVG